MSEQLDPLNDARPRLFNHFNKVDDAQHVKKWDELWKEDYAPWDRGVPNPALVDLLNERQDLFEAPPKGRTRKALVPGCGRGYDVLLFAAHGYDAYGLEFSGKALENARKVEKEMNGKGDYETKAGVERGSVTWLEGDFFKDDALKNVEGGGTFDIVYDYTFLSALPPTMRPAWSKRMSELVAPEGRLVCVEFPTYKEASTGGPPWALPPKIYKHHLPRPGEKLPYDKDGELMEADIGEQKTPAGLVQIAHFQPERTHAIGYDAEGKITDWVGVWAHPKR